MISRLQITPGQLFYREKEPTRLWLLLSVVRAKKEITETWLILKKNPLQGEKTLEISTYTIDTRRLGGGGRRGEWLDWIAV